MITSGGRLVFVVTHLIALGYAALCIVYGFKEQCDGAIPVFGSIGSSSTSISISSSSSTSSSGVVIFANGSNSSYSSSSSSNSSSSSSSPGFGGSANCTHLDARTVYVTNVHFSHGEFHLLHPVYMAAISQGVAALFLLLIELPGSCVRPITDTRFRVSLVKTGLAGAPLQIAALLALSDSAIVPFLSAATTPPATAIAYIGIAQLRNRRGQLWIMSGIGFLLMLSLTAIGITLFLVDLPIRELRFGRGVLFGALCAQCLLEWGNQLVHVQWKVESHAALYVHSLISDAGRFLVFWSVLALHQRDVLTARNYIVLGAAGAGALVFLLCAIPTKRGVAVAGHVQKAR